MKSTAGASSSGQSLSERVVRHAHYCLSCVGRASCAAWRPGSCPHTWLKATTGPTVAVGITKFTRIYAAELQPQRRYSQIVGCTATTRMNWALPFGHFSDARDAWARGRNGSIAPFRTREKQTFGRESTTTGLSSRAR